jgi:transposase
MSSRSKIREAGAMAEVKRGSAGRKKEVVLRSEPVDAISREVGVPIYKLE